MRDVKPWATEGLEAVDSCSCETIRDYLDEVVVTPDDYYGIWIDPKHLHTLLHAPVYEAIVRELARLNIPSPSLESGDLKNQASRRRDEARLMQFELACRLVERAREALKKGPTE